MGLDLVLYIAGKLGSIHGSSIPHRILWGALPRHRQGECATRHLSGCEDRQRFLEVLGRVVSRFHLLLKGD